MNQRELYTEIERERYNKQREDCCLRLGITKNQYNAFRRDGEHLRKIYEMQCNGFSSPQAEKRADKNEELYYRLLKEKAQGFGLYIYFQTDPRGASIYLDKEPIPINNYTQSFCIY